MSVSGADFMNHAAVGGRGVAVEYVMSIAAGQSATAEFVPLVGDHVANVSEVGNNASCATSERTFSLSWYEWRGRIEGRFRSLVRLRALGKATPSDIDELEALKLARRRKMHVRTFDQIASEDRQSRLLGTLRKALEQYVECQTQSPATHKKT